MESTSMGGAGARRPAALLVPLAAFGLALLLSTPGHAASHIPWQVGDHVEGVGDLERAERHPEYLRTTWRAGEAVHRIEIVPLADPDDPWAAGPYRVQPSLGAQTPPAALRALQSDLRSRASAPDHVVFVATAQAATSPSDALPVPMSRGDVPYPPAGAPWLLLVAIMGCLGGLAALYRHLPPGTESRVLLWGSLAAVGGGLGVLMGLDPMSLDPALLVVIHEGSTEHVVRSLWGAGHHGPMHDALRWAAGDLTGASELIPLRVIALMNLSLAVVNGVGLLVAGRLILGRWPLAIVTTAATLLCPLFLNAATSELPAQLLFTLTLAGAAAWTALGSHSRLAWSSLALVTVALGLTRGEWGMAGAIVMACAAITPWWERTARGGPWRAVSVALVVGGAIWQLLPRVLEAERATYLSVGLSPFDPAPMFAGVVFAVGLGVGVFLLACGGGARLLAAPRAVGVPLALVVLTRMYGEASHRAQAPYEALRYAQFLLPLIALLAMVGWRALFAATSMRPGRRCGLALLLIVLHFAPLGEPIAGAVFPHHHLGGGPLYEAPLDRDQQREARALLALAEERSPCVAVTVSARDPKPTDPIEGWDYVFFGGSLSTPLTVVREPPRLSAHLEGLGSKSCARFFAGLDCHVEEYPGCDVERALGRPDPATDVAGRPYYDHLRRSSTARLEVVRWGPSNPSP